MKKQVLLIQPPVEDFYYTDCRTQPLGLCYISSAIRQNFPDIEVVIYDVQAGGKKQNIPWPPEFFYLKKYYGSHDRSPFKLFYHYSRFGKPQNEIIQDLKSFSPILIGISSMFTPYYRQSLEMAAICREIFPAAKIVMGGHHATVEPASLLLAPNQTASKHDQPYLADFMIAGEGEVAIVHLLRKLLNKELESRALTDIPGVITRETLNQPALNINTSPDIHAIPRPDVAGLDMSNYSFAGKPMCFLVTSRGCPYHCTFCAIHSVFGSKYRRRKNPEILAEIQERVNQGFLHIDIEDDHFTANKRATSELLDLIIEKKWPLTFSAMNGLVYWSLDSSLLIKMKMAGFAALNLSFVSEDHDLLHDTKRPAENSKFSEIVFEAHNTGLLVTAYFILGMPGQSISDMAETMRFLAGLPVLLGASPYYLSPGTPDYKKWKGSRLLQQASSEDSFFSARLTALDIEIDDFSRDDIYTFFRASRMINYIKQGIDSGFPWDHVLYNPVREILREKKWYAESKNEKVELPYSRPVMDSLMQPPFVVTGYKTSSSITIAEGFIYSGIKEQQ